MFENSPNLKRIKGLDKWDTSNATGFDEMFGRCYALEELDLSSWDTSKAKNGDKASTNGHTTGTFRNFINDCRSLKKLILGPKFKVNGDGTNTNASYRLVLPTPSTDYHIQADGYWYDADGNKYSPTEIQDGAGTYYASKFLADTSELVLVKKPTIRKITNAIRAKTGRDTKFGINSIADEIESIRSLEDAPTFEYSNEYATKIGSRTFYEMEELVSVNAPLVTEVEEGAFWYCSNLTDVNLPALTKLGHNAFRDCASLVNFDFSNITSIGARTFHSCKLLGAGQEVTFPNLTVIDNQSFCWTAYKALHFPALTTVGGGWNF